MVQSKLLRRSKLLSPQLPPPDDVVFWSTAVIGQVIDDRVLSTSAVESAVNSLFADSSSAVRVTRVFPDNLFLLSCSTARDRDDLLHLESVVIMGVLLVLRPCDPRADPKEWRVTHAPLWVQMRGIPLGLCNLHVAAELGRLLGEVDDVEVRKRGVVRVKVRVEVDRPVLPGACLDGAGENNKEEGEGVCCWVSFQYENVCRVCKKCWRLGHLAESCLVAAENTARENHAKVVPVFSLSTVNKS